ncbi:MAG: radical SAM protein [Bacteroidales bacterium]|nr:radical SAM protein [Bacteroidales bacterium]
MLRFEDIVFGPIHSRRLGSSLGVNLLPRKGKFCNFDCVYCECGWNSDGREDKTMPEISQVAEALELKLRSLSDRGVHIDSITFSGNGEPTLNPDFPSIIDVTLALRDKYYPQAKVSVLSNASMLGRPDVFNALMKVDNPILKVDAVREEDVAKVNRPAFDWKLEPLIESLKRFEGKFVLQTMFLSWEEFDSSENIQAWIELVRQSTPRSIMVYTLDRETPQKGLVKFTEQRMRELVAPLIEEGFDIMICG